MTNRKDFIFTDDHSDFAGEWRAFETAQSMEFDARRCGQVGILLYQLHFDSPLGVDNAYVTALLGHRVRTKT